MAWLKIKEGEYIKWKINNYLTGPRVGDSIIIRTDDSSPYTILKIINVDQDQITYVRSQFNFSSLEGVKDQMLNPQTDKGRGQYTINKDKLCSFDIVEIYGQARIGKISL